MEYPYCDDSCLFCGKHCEPLIEERRKDMKEKNKVCPFVKRHNVIQSHIIENHAEKHLWYHPDLKTLENARLDLLHMIAPLMREYECESCVHNSNCEVQEEVNHER